MLDEDSEIVSIYIGEDGAEELASSLAQDLMEQFEDVEVEIHQAVSRSIHIFLVLNKRQSKGCLFVIL